MFDDLWTIRNPTVRMALALRKYIVAEEAESITLQIALRPEQRFLEFPFVIPEGPHVVIGDEVALKFGTMVFRIERDNGRHLLVIQEGTCVSSSRP
jgi:hypothetical protein